jgi:hypothetical protein
MGLGGSFNRLEVEGWRLQRGVTLQPPTSKLQPALINSRISSESQA